MTKWTVADIPMPASNVPLKGDRVPVPIPKPALDEAAAGQLWETAEGLTVTAWRVAEPARVFARG
jgi:hypothetical protein